VELTAECATVARAEGVEIGDYEGFNPHYLATAPRQHAITEVRGRGETLEVMGLTAMRISMLQDVLRGRPTEVEETLGYVVRRGAALGVAVPLTRFAYGVIRGVEAYL
jgi:ketopantoate reductase